MQSISETANITRGLINRVEVCVINKIWNYEFNKTNNNNKQVVERPKLPTLKIGESGIVQNGLVTQTKLGGNNHYELIENGRYKQVKELMGYVGIKTSEYDLFKVINKETKNRLHFVNCGSNDTIKINKDIYTSDNGSGGIQVSKETQVANGIRWGVLYQTARSMGPSENGTITWNFNVNNNSIYEVKLRFADYWVSPNRNFDITINGTIRKEKFNIVEAASGTFKRTDLEFRVPVNDGKINITLNGNSHLNAIEIYSLAKGDIKFEEVNRDHTISNKDAYAFINKNISISEKNLKNKFLEIQGTTLKSRNLFFI